MKHITQKELDELIKTAVENFIYRKSTKFDDSMKKLARKNMTSGMWTHGTSTGKMSPTDVDAKGLYPYQEPEVDEQGTYYGYKVLHKCRDDRCIGFVSPRYNVHWDSDGELQADREPDERHMHGLHFTKRPDHPELRNYFGQFHGHSMYAEMETNWVLVKCALSGTIVETEQGFRAEHAQIIGVCDRNGNWQSYQDYQERARAHSRRVAEITWEEERWRLAYGANWTQGSTIDITIDPTSDT